MVQLDLGPDDVEGTLALGSQALVFTASGPASTRTIALTDVHKVKRIVGSPVLLVRSLENDAKRTTAFYFTKPPALHPEQPAPDTPPPTLMGPFARTGQPSKRKQRRNNAGYLASATHMVSGDLRAWTSAIRTAVSQARRAANER
jgi:hypothetical protein